MGGYGMRFGFYRRGIDDWFECGANLPISLGSTIIL